MQRRKGESEAECRVGYGDWGGSLTNCLHLRQWKHYAEKSFKLRAGYLYRTELIIPQGRTARNGRQGQGSWGGGEEKVFIVTDLRAVHTS